MQVPLTSDIDDAKSQPENNNKIEFNLESPESESVSNKVGITKRSSQRNKKRVRVTTERELE